MTDDENLRRMLSAPEKKTKGYIPGMFLSKRIEQSSLGARTFEFQGAIMNKKEGIWHPECLKNALRTTYIVCHARIVDCHVWYQRLTNQVSKSPKVMLNGTRHLL